MIRSASLPGPFRESFGKVNDQQSGKVMRNPWLPGSGKTARLCRFRTGSPSSYQVAVHASIAVDSSLCFHLWNACIVANEGVIGTGPRDKKYREQSLCQASIETMSGGRWCRSQVPEFMQREWIESRGINTFIGRSADRHDHVARHQWSFRLRPMHSMVVRKRFSLAILEDGIFWIGNCHWAVVTRDAIPRTVTEDSQLLRLAGKGSCHSCPDGPRGADT